MFVETILDDPTNSHLLLTSGASTDIVIGVPHHAPLGTTQLPCKEHPKADENAGFLGYYVSGLLNCPCVIACNYFLDPNKDRATDYCKKILSVKPKFLIEIHGHSGNSAKFDVEISSGSRERNFWSKEMAKRLRETFSGTASLKEYTLSGNFDEVYFTAKNSRSITADEWIGFHIELPKSIRQYKSQYVQFCELLADAASGILADFDKLSKSQAQSTG